MARTILKLDTSQFDQMLRRLEKMGGDAKSAVSLALNKASEKISNDTLKALEKENLPAKGKYSQGATKESVIQNPTVEWDGMVGWIPVGFDFSKEGSGGFLISGTPDMAPDANLRKIYKGKKYMTEVQEMIQGVIWDQITEEF